MDGNSLLREGKMFFASGRPEASLELFTAALEKGADPVAIGLSRGAAHLALRRFNEAEEDFSLALRREPDNERALYYRGIARVAAGRYRDAVGDLSLSLAANKERGIAYLVRGLAYAELGDQERAGVDFTSAADYSAAEVRSFFKIFNNHPGQLTRTMAMLKRESAPWKALLTEQDRNRLHHLLDDNPD